MQFLGGLRVNPQLPARIKRLQDLAGNFYFAWHPEVRDLFIAIDRELWKKTNHNPVKFLIEVQQKKLDAAEKDTEFIKKYQKVIREFDDYMKEKDTWFSMNHSPADHFLVGYFTAEFGFHESLPIYAGGLGVLAGDHMKSASDLGIPIVGISLFYNQTYFTQEIDTHGNQVAIYNTLNPRELPLHPVNNSDGTPLLVSVPVANREIFIRVWEARVGRRIAYLLDSDTPENSSADREITGRLYGGDQEMRIAQEIILGMGGVMVLDAMGIKPTIWHMNEGHSVFLVLQRIQQLVQKAKL
ncbi:MAG: alpha-glucan family phosphorylase, partial [Calditrichaeota bacterium]|nr:alpha-glucan family phosphorylase [Calditrichota bacterium]